MASPCFWGNFCFEPITAVYCTDLIYYLAVFQLCFPLRQLRSCNGYSFNLLSLPSRPLELVLLLFATTTLTSDLITFLYFQTKNFYRLFTIFAFLLNSIVTSLIHHFSLGCVYISVKETGQPEGKGNIPTKS